MSPSSRHRGLGPESLLNASATPFSHNHTSSRASMVYASSPTSTYTPTVTSGTAKLNVVTRIAIEGKSQPSLRESGAEIRMYLKIALPLESITPGLTIPLFPEDSVRITMSQVHPLDQSSAPYHFSTEQHPLLYKAAKALNLPRPSPMPYHSVFDSVMEPASSRATTSSLGHSDDAASVDPNYAGHILVSGYQICYILPKEFPPLLQTSGHSSRSRTPYKNRRSSLGEKHVLQFMAAIQMYIPYITMPPRNPYLLSIPTPRCLQNSIKFRIVSNKPVSTSLASLSSVEEEADWDFSADPSVTRRASRLNRADPMNTDFADDESSDSSITDKMVSSSQGTFQSTDRIRIRWAKRSKSAALANAPDGWSRIVVDRARGEMKCSVLGHGTSRDKPSLKGVVVRLEFTGTCSGLFFPGVATLVGMDVGLEAKGSDLAWVDGYEQHWSVTGGRGFTGFNVSGPRQSGPPSGDSALQDSSSTSPEVGPASSLSRRGSMTSLLRAPLPTQHMPEYSFEGSTALTPSTTLSSIGLLSASSGSGLHDGRLNSPSSPITVHVNMNELIPPAINNFTFTVTGVCVLTPRHPDQTARGSPYSSSSNSESDAENDNHVIVLPRFTVLAAQAETTTTIIENKVEFDDSRLIIYNPSGDISRDAQALKTVLLKGGSATCAEDGGRISLRPITKSGRNGSGHAGTGGNIRAAAVANRPTAPLGKLTESMGLVPSRRPSKHPRDVPHLIPHAMATVTPLQIGRTAPLGAYAVRLSLPVPVDPENGCLEFGLAQLRSSPECSSSIINTPSTIDIASASIDGIPVPFEIATPKPEKQQGPQFEQLSGQEWLRWVIVHTTGFDGGILVIDYIVKESGFANPRSKGKGKAMGNVYAEIFLPAFSLPIGRLEAVLESPPGFRILSLQSNLAHQQATGNGFWRLLHFSTDPSYLPRLSVQMSTDSSNSMLTLPSFLSILRILVSSTLLVLSLITVFGLTSLATEIQRIDRSLNTYSIIMNPDRSNPPEPVTVTTTLYATSMAGGSVCLADSAHKDHMDRPSVTATTPAHDYATRPSTAVSATPMQPSPRKEDPPGADETESNDTSVSASLFLAYHNIIHRPLSLESVDVHVALDKVLHTIDAIWQVMRKIYHYLRRFIPLLFCQ